jgi:hypothetical protein
LIIRRCKIPNRCIRLILILDRPSLFRFSPGFLSY